MKIWYDVSGIYWWEGNFTGIQRVVYNIAKELHALDSSVGLFIYDNGNFREVTYEDFDARVKQRVSGGPSTNQEDEAHQKLSLAKLQHYGFATAKNLVRDTQLERPLRAVYGGLRKGYRSARSQKTQLKHEAPFKKGDAVLVIDGNWQFHDYVEQLLAARERTGCKLVHLVHDMIAIRNPALANPGAKKIISTYFSKVFATFDALIAISEATKTDILWFMGSNGIEHEPQLFVVLEGDEISPERQRIKPVKPAIDLPDDFILAVSTVEIRKNYLAFYYVYRLADQQNIDLPRLLIVGRKGWMAQETEALLTQDPVVNKKVSILHHVPDAELEWLYANCKFTVFPSFAEGWGLPIAESLAHGKACISSNVSSMPEVGDNLVAYTSPYDTRQIMDAILQYMDPVVRLKVEAAISKEYKSRTWEDSARKLVSILNGLEN